MTLKANKKTIKEEERRRLRCEYIIEKEIRNLGRDPIPGEIERIIEKRKGTIRSKNPVIEYYRFYRSGIEPNVPTIKHRIEESKTNEIKMYIEDFAKRIAMTGKNPHTIVGKSRPALLIEGITIDLGDKGRLITMKKTKEKEKLTGLAKNIANRVCRSDPQTDDSRVIEFQNKICQLDK